jgi:hypothetical protein
LCCIYFGSRNREDIEEGNVEQYKAQENITLKEER